MKIVFLDFDNVLNCDSTKDWIKADAHAIFSGDGHCGLDPEKVLLVDDICKKTGAVVVFSTSWRKLYTSGELLKFLRDRGFTGELYPDSFPDTLAAGDRQHTPIKMSYLDRGSEIRLWFANDREHEPLPESFVVLDDVTTCFRDTGRQVETNEIEGLTRELADQAIEILKRPCTRAVNIYKESYDVYIGRRNPSLGINPINGYYGNPFVLKPKASESERYTCLMEYEEHFRERIENDPEFARNIQGLKGKKLGCYCAPKHCHGDVISWHLECGSLR